jgi:OOP family OmpA-OmpF porin
MKSTDSTLFAIALTICLGAPLSAAAGSPWYLGAGVGQADAHYTGAEVDRDLAARGHVTTTELSDSDTGYKLFAGYRLGARLAAEVAWVDLGTIESTTTATSIAGTNEQFVADLQAVHPFLARGLTGAAVGRWSPHARIDLFGKAGLFVWRANVRYENTVVGAGRNDDTGVDVFAGVGAQYHIGARWSLRVEWERYRIEDNWADFPVVSIMRRL